MSVYGFRFYFTPLKGVLFAFPSRYLSAIGSCLVFSLGSWSTRIPAGFLVPRRTQVPHQRVRSISPTRLSRSPACLPRHFRYKPVFSQLFGSSPCGPTTPHYAVWAPPLSLAATYGISGGSLLFLISFPVLLRWFVSLHRPILFSLVATASLPPGYPIRPSADHRTCAPTRGFSQLITAFFALQLPGIRHKPIFA